MAGLLTHFKADAITGLSNGGAVASWPDSSGNGYTATQGTGGAQPTWRATDGPNGKPCVRFDGGDALDTSAQMNTKPMSFFAVVKTPTDDSQPKTILGPSPASNGWQWRIYNKHSNFLQAQQADVSTGSTALTDQTWYVLGFTYGSAGECAHYLNGVLDGTNTNSRSPSAATQRIGGGAELWNSDIAEIITYDVLLTATERGGITGYLGGKYNIAVSNLWNTAPSPMVMG